MKKSNSEKLDSIIVVGNGPSSASIDYCRVPPNIKVMRVSGFFREDKYYVGKKVDYYVDYYRRLEEMYFTIRSLKENNEYDINLEEIWMTVMDSTNPFFPAVKDCTGFIEGNKRIAEFRNFYIYYYGQYVPTGLQALALAVCMGYENVYVAGLDLMSDKFNMHPYSVDINDTIRMSKIEKKSLYETHIDNIGADTPEEAVYERVMKNHPVEMQVKFIKLLRELYPNTNIMSASVNSPINDYIDAAPQLLGSPWHIANPKPDSRTKTILPLPEAMPKFIKK